MRARTLVTAVGAIAAVVSLVACAPSEPRTAYSAPAEAYGVEPQALQSLPLPRGGDQDKPAPLWPRVFTSGDTTFATYEPAIESWANGKLVARVAVEVYPPGATVAKYGFVWFEAPTTTDAERGVVTLGDPRITRARFPTAKDREGAYVEALRGAELAESKSVSLGRLQREREFGAAARPVPAAPAIKGSKEPPAILVSDRPETVVEVAGAPQLRNEGALQRVVNTRSLLLTDGEAYYVWIGDRWFRSPSLDGEYTETREAPSALDAVKSRLSASREVDLFTDATARVREGMKVVVTTKPAALIQTRGAPTYERIAGTPLSWLSNTDSDVLRDDATGQTYALLGGRWFRARSLSGPWTFTEGKELPGTFRYIPKDHREARVLASIPGTPEADEAAIAASIPQTAVVDRARARLAVAYEGEPDFRPVEGASQLSYAVNSSTPVIAASDGLYYAVENGVWFVSASPNGPWTVATSVPDDIYAIPESSPVHHVTYVRVYAYSPDYVDVGYLPGYLGVYYMGGVVVLGAGYGLGWYGSYGPYGPYGHYGYYGHGPWHGHGWSGPPGYWRGPAWGWRGPTYVAGGNIYGRWAPSVVHAPPAHLTRPRVSAPPARVPASPSVGPRATARPYPPSYVPRTSAPAYAPRVPPPAYAPRTSAPAYYPRMPPPSYVPRTSAPAYHPRMPPPSYVPRTSAPAYHPRMPSPSVVAPRAPSGGVMRAHPPPRR